jgi:uncharacterized protein
MPLDALGDWLARLTPRPRVDSVSMLDGYVTAIVVGPCHIPPDAWLAHLLGPDGDIATAHGEDLAAITAIAARHNVISEGLATAPDRHAPIFVHDADGSVRAGPWCMGFLAAMQLRFDAWAALRDLDRIDHGLLLPILLHCTDRMGRPMLGPPREGPETAALLREAWRDIPAVIPAIRDFWMPQRSAEWSSR